MTALLAVLASMHGCPSLAVPFDPVPVRGTYTRCDPARLGWAEDGSFWWQVQTGQLTFRMWPVKPTGGHNE